MESITTRIRSLMHSVTVRPTAGGVGSGSADTDPTVNHRKSTPQHRRAAQPYRTSSVESQHSQQQQQCVDYTIDANNRSITANKLVDKLLDYLRENYVQPIDPYVFDKTLDFSPRKYVKFMITSGKIYGLTNFERIGDSFIVRSPESDLKFRLCSYVLVTDVVFNLKFCATFTPIRIKRKDLRIFCEKCVIYAELTLDLRPSKKMSGTHVRQIKLVSMEGLECRTGGIIFPINKSVDSLITKVLHNLRKNFDQYAPDLLTIINMFCQQYLDNVFKLSNFTEMFM